MATLGPARGAKVAEPAVDTAPAVAADTVVAHVDPVLLEILGSEVGGHLETVDAWLAQARAGDASVNDGLLRAIHTLNGAFRHSREARRRYPVNPAWMNAEDMAEAGIAEGDLVEVASAHGALRTVARADARLRRGVVSITHMFGPLVSTGDPVGEGGANVGQLTSLSEHLQPINFMPRFSAVPGNGRPV